MRKVVDWALLETDYIHGYFVTNENGQRVHIYPTAEKLGAKYECSVSMIQNRCAQEKWLVRREQYKEKIKDLAVSRAEKDKTNSINLLMSESSKYDTQNLQKLDQVDKILNIYLHKYSSLLDPDTASFLEGEEDKQKIDLKEINMMMDILLKKHQLSRSIFGESTSVKPSEVRKDDIKKESIKFKNNKEKTNNLEKIVNIIKSNSDLKEKLKKEKQELESLITGTKSHE